MSPSSTPRAGRPRLSTVILLVAFVATATLYVLVRPDPLPDGTNPTSDRTPTVPTTEPVAPEEPLPDDTAPPVTTTAPRAPTPSTTTPRSPATQAPPATNPGATSPATEPQE